MRVLYADDDADDCTLLQEALDEINAAVECTTVNNGQEALDFLEASVEMPDFILLDINMPVMDGRACLQALKRDHRFREIPVVVYSTTCNQYEILQLLEMGASAFICKPHSFNDLCKGLARIIKRVKAGVIV